MTIPILLYSFDYSWNFLGVMFAEHDELISALTTTREEWDNVDNVDNYQLFYRKWIHREILVVFGLSLISGAISALTHSFIKRRSISN